MRVIRHDRGPRQATGPSSIAGRASSAADDYFVTDFVAWNVAFDSVVLVHAPVFNKTLSVVVTEWPTPTPAVYLETSSNVAGLTPTLLFKVSVFAVVDVLPLFHLIVPELLAPLLDKKAEWLRARQRLFRHSQHPSRDARRREAATCPQPRFSSLQRRMESSWLTSSSWIYLASGSTRPCRSTS